MKPHIIRFSLIAALLTSSAMSENHSSNPTTTTMTLPKPPATVQHPVTDDYFGRKIVDPYRWLEDGKSSETEQ